MLKRAGSNDTDSPLPDDIPLTREILDTFRGRPVMMIPNVIKMVATGILAWACIILFFFQDNVREQIAYAAAANVFVTVAAATALVFWVQMNHYRTVREIKRLELQCALLMRAIEKREEEKETA